MRSSIFKKRYVLYIIAVCILPMEVYNIAYGILDQTAKDTNTTYGILDRIVKSAFNTDTDTTIGSKESVILPYLNRTDSDTLFDRILQEAQEAMKQNSSLVLHSMEVGMHSARQCLLQARRNLLAHCVEPSPVSFHRIRRQISKAPEAERKKVRFYQLAASDRSGIDLEFSSSGGTGDHVGVGYDPWSMIKKEPTVKIKDEKAVTPRSSVIVKSVSIDDIIYNKIGPSIDYAKVNGETSVRVPNIDRIFLLKVDTQGYEPSVFSGLRKSIREHKIDMILTEYWPKGIDFLNDNIGPEKECKMAVSLLQLLVDAGYTLFSLSISVHPKAPKDLAYRKVQDLKFAKVIPWNTLREHCMWFYDLERKYRDNGGIMADGKVYEMGYWTDILAVRPGFTFPVAPHHKWTKAIANHL